MKLIKPAFHWLSIITKSNPMPQVSGGGVPSGGQGGDKERSLGSPPSRLYPQPRPGQFRQNKIAPIFKVRIQTIFFPLMIVNQRIID